ncbi:sortase domain-bontaining protein [Kitasatospora sp. Root107]|uniref:sortase domain-containing protein n=1 Tax=Kitasatospora sp. Root107 TaxID=1736424 RepID=UPI0035132D85
MPHPDVRTRGLRRRDRGRLTAAVVALSLLLGGWLVHDGVSGDGPPPVGAAVARASGPSGPPDTSGGAGQSGGTGQSGGAGQASPNSEAKPGSPPPEPLPASVPTSLRIPAIKVSAPLLGLGLDASGHLDTPPVGKPNQAGWYRDSPSPGSAGNAIMAGHADTRSGPAVFYRLGLLRPGDKVEVVRQDRRQGRGGPRRSSPSTRYGSTPARTFPTPPSTVPPSGPNCASSPAAGSTTRSPDTRTTSWSSRTSARPAELTLPDRLARGG